MWEPSISPRPMGCSLIMVDLFFLVFFILLFLLVFSLFFTFFKVDWVDFLLAEYAICDSL